MRIEKWLVTSLVVLACLAIQERAGAGALFVDAADDQSAAGVVPAAVTLTYGAGWSMISLPVLPDNRAFDHLFPDAISAFKFDNGYQQVDSLNTCEGYWLNLSTGGEYVVSGDSVRQCSGSYNAGWSMIGAPIGGTLASAISQNPSGNLISVFGFRGGYFQADTLKEGAGYWVNLTNSGSLDLTGGIAGAAKAAVTVHREVAPTESRIVVRSGDQEQTLSLGAAAESIVELPPLPPAGALDARAQVAGVSTQRIPAAATPVDYRVHLQGTDLNLEWNIDAADTGRWALVVDGTTHQLAGTGTLNFQQPPQDMWLRYTPAAPQQFALLANYPNPFNPSTTIRYQLAAASDVKLAVYDALGQKIVDLVNMRQPAGSYSVVWDGRDASGMQAGNGVYFYKLQAGSYQSMRKMALMQ